MWVGWRCSPGLGHGFLQQLFTLEGMRTFRGLCLGPDGGVCLDVQGSVRRPRPGGWSRLRVGGDGSWDRSSLPQCTAVLTLLEIRWPSKCKSDSIYWFICLCSDWYILSFYFHFWISLKIMYSFIILLVVTPVITKEFVTYQSVILLGSFTFFLNNVRNLEYFNSIYHPPQLSCDFLKCVLVPYIFQTSQNILIVLAIDSQFNFSLYICLLCCSSFLPASLHFHLLSFSTCLKNTL